MNNPKKIGFYNNPEALGLVECLRINLDAICRMLDIIKQEQAISENHPKFLKGMLQKPVEYIDREKLFDKEKDNGTKKETF